MATKKKPSVPKNALIWAVIFRRTYDMLKKGDYDGVLSWNKDRETAIAEAKKEVVNGGYEEDTELLVLAVELWPDAILIQKSDYVEEFIG